MKNRLNDITNLNALRVFKVVAEQSSFIEASRFLSVTQPAISKTIKNLEKDMNIKLFHRNRNITQLTQDGVLLYHAVNKSYNLLNNALEKIEDEKHENLTIGIQSHFARFFLFDKIAEIIKEKQNINIKLIDMSSHDLIKKLENFELDFIIDSSPISISKDMISHKIASLDTCFVASNKFQILEDDINHLIANNTIVPLPRSTIRMALQKELMNQKYTMNPILEVETTDLILEAVKRNYGTMKVIDCGISMPKLDMYFIYKKDYMSKDTISFIEKYFCKETNND